jgi:2-oxoglutarate ferredoxin oxidoreductase subunit alpha
MDLTIRISGAQGEGIETTGRTLAAVFAKLSYYVFAFRQYGSIIKGNPTMFY